MCICVYVYVYIYIYIYIYIYSALACEAPGAGRVTKPRQRPYGQFQKFNQEKWAQTLGDLNF